MRDGGRRRPGPGSVALDAAFAAGTADLRSVYDAHGRLVHAICLRTLDPEAAKDVTQDVFVSAWRGRHQFDPDRGNLAAWLTGITRRRIVDHVRSQRRHTARRSDGGHDDPTMIADPAAEADLDRAVDRAVVAEALRRLADRPRRAIVLAYVEGLTHDEIAVRTDLPLGTVKSDIRRGLAQIRSALEVTRG